MKIAILTVHAQINFGAVLQAYALQTFLSNLGYDVTILNRWITPDNRDLLGPLSSCSLRCWFQVLIRGLLGLHDFALIRRSLRTHSFINRHLKCSSPHFNNWHDAPPINFDLIIVGSDQIWNTSAHNPNVFLLVDAPNIPAITYAASFGTDSINPTHLPLFKTHLTRFHALSVREKQGQSILASINFPSTHVLDPTLLLSPSDYTPLFAPISHPRYPSLVCYLVSFPTHSESLALRYFAQKHNCLIHLFIATPTAPMPCSPSALFLHIKDALQRPFTNITIHASASPATFLTHIANATWVISGTFHGLMFATIFRKNFRIAVCDYAKREANFRRISEFTSVYLSKKTIQPDLPQALKSLSEDPPTAYNSDALVQAQAASRKWLKSTIAATQSETIH